MLILPVVNEDFKRKTKSEIGSQESIKTRG